MGNTFTVWAYVLMHRTWDGEKWTPTYGYVEVYSGESLWRTLRYAWAAKRGPVQAGCVKIEWR